MTDMIAIRPFRYATRALRAGEGFIAKSKRDARILVAIGKARVKREPGKIDPPPAELAQRIAATVQHGDDLAALRADYQSIVGKRPFMGWDAATLRAKIGEARVS